MTSGGSRISPRRGRQLPGGRQHTILPIFPKNCMKLKEFGPSGGASKILLCRSATDYYPSTTPPPLWPRIFLTSFHSANLAKLRGEGGANPVILFHHPYYPATTGSKNIWTEPWQMCVGGGEAGGSKRESGLYSFVMQFSAKKFARLVTSGIYWIGHCVRCGVLLWLL